MQDSLTDKACPVGSVLEFLQHKFSSGAAATNLRVYVAAIAARRDSDDIPLGRHRLVSSFMRGAKHLSLLVRPPSFPSWDLSVVLKGLLGPPFEPLNSAPMRILTLNVTLLLALTSFKRVGDLTVNWVHNISQTPGFKNPPFGGVKLLSRKGPGTINGLTDFIREIKS